MKATTEKESSWTGGDRGKKLLKVSASCLYGELKPTHCETLFIHIWENTRIVLLIINGTGIPTEFLNANDFNMH